VNNSEIWLQLRPGTDDALGLAFLNVIIEEDLYDHHFCENYTHGFRELAEDVHKLTPEGAEPITWRACRQDSRGCTPVRSSRTRDARMGLRDRAHAEHDPDDRGAVDDPGDHGQHRCARRLDLRLEGRRPFPEPH
jgi:hypothetical protein